MIIDDLTGKMLGSQHNDFVIVRWTAEVGDHWIAPLHVHHEDDEAWVVLTGRLEFRLGDRQFVVEQGGAVLAQRGVPHTYRNAGDVDAAYLLVMTPRIAALIEQVHEPAADIPAVFAAHASSLVAEG